MRSIFLACLSLLLASTTLAQTNSASAYLFDFSRVRVLDTAPVHPSANPSAYMVTGNEITVETWVFTTSLPDQGERAILVQRAYWNIPPFYSYELSLSNQEGSGVPRYKFSITDGNVPTVGASVLSADVSALGEWTHVAGSYDGNMLRLYVNGELAGETPHTGQIGPGITGLYLGGLSWPVDTHQGLMDDVRLWNVSRTQADIQSTMATSLTGSETGLVGYWPLEATYESSGMLVTADLTANHNDLILQGNAQIVDFPVDSDVSLPPYFTSVSLSAVIDETLEIQLPTGAGWPPANVNLQAGPTGLSIDPATRILSWTPMVGQLDYHIFTYELSNPSGSASGDSYIWVDAVGLESVTHDIGNVNLSYANNGAMANYPGNDPEQGFVYNGLNGLFAGNLLLGVSTDQVSGGLYVEEFAMLSGINSVESTFLGFEQAYESQFDDGRALMHIGINVVQRSHASSNPVDGDYIIMEYELTNENDFSVAGLYAGLSTDWDVGDPSHNLAGFDADHGLSYVYELGGAQNPYYYGVAALNQAVSGQSSAVVGGSDDALSYADLTTMMDLPTEPQDIRSTLGCGPFDLAPGETVTVRYAILGGENLSDLQANAQRAYDIQSDMTFSLASAYLHDYSRIRVTDGAPVHPEANPSAYMVTGNQITVEAWVFPTGLPAEGNSAVLVQRPFWNAEPFHAYELSISNLDGIPRYRLSVNDGNDPGSGASVTSVNAVTLGDWNHVAGSYDGSVLRLYVDGELAGESSYTGSIGNGDTGFYMGGFTSAANSHQGLLDEVRLWNVGRSQAEIQATMEVSLSGTEAGLVGYWPLEESYEFNGFQVIADRTANHNDLVLQGNAQIVGFPAGFPDVALAPTAQYYSLSAYAGLTMEFPMSARSGWPPPSVSLLEGPAGLFIDPETNLLTWTPDEDQRGWHEFTYEVSNAAGSASGNSHIWVDAVLRESVTHGTGNAQLTYANNGTMGFYDHPANNEGFTFGGMNGLYAANLMLGLSDTQVSGGLYVEEFGTLSGIMSVESGLAGFDQAYESHFDDARSPNPIGISVLQRTHSKSTSPDEDYIIVEYELTNENDGPVSGLYVGLSADWDVGNAFNNLGGYDADRGLSYVYEADGALNPSYYGVAALGHAVSGHTMSSPGGYDDAVNYGDLTTFFELPAEAQDVRSTLGVGPFDLASGETVVVRYAILGGDDMADIQANADQAHSVVSGGMENLASAYLFEYSRIRVVDGAAVHPEANPSAYAIDGSAITVEAWVFPTRLPEENSRVPLVQRPYSGAEPWHAYELSLSNDDGSGIPKYGFSVTDGNIPFNGALAASTSPVAWGEWTHVAGSYDGSMVRIYINGVLESESAFDAPIGTGNTGLYVGGLSAAVPSLQGLLDEVRLWNVARSQAEIQAAMNTPLSGTEAGLAGYWPLEESYEFNGLQVVADMTVNHNDLVLQGNSRIEVFPSGSAVTLAPTYQYYSLSAVIDVNLVIPISVGSGWPMPSVSLLEGPEGLFIDPETNLLTWTPSAGQRGWHPFSYEASNAAGSVSGVSDIWVDILGRETVTQDISNADLTFSNNGVMGFYGHSEQNEGFTFNGVNGLYAANLVLGVSDTQVSGGLYVEEFGTLSGIMSVESGLAGFDQAYETQYDDERSWNPLGLSVLQRTHSKSTSPDEDYIIVEYELTNENDGPVSGLYVGLSADWDVGDAFNNVGGYDADRGLSYVYEADGALNPSYYGVAALGHAVSGHTMSSPGGYDDAVNYGDLTTFFELPAEAQDVRSTLGVGPLDLASGETVVVRYAILGGDDMADIQANADQAHRIFTVSTDGIAGLPDAYGIKPNYPNPFNPSTKISYALPEQTQVYLTIFDIKGQEIRTLQEGIQAAGSYTLLWNGLNQDGIPVSAGVYFCRLQTEAFSGSIKMLYLE